MAESGDGNLGSAFSSRVIAEVTWWSLSHSQREKITAVSLSQCVLMSATCLQHVSLHNAAAFVMMLIIQFSFIYIATVTSRCFVL